MNKSELIESISKSTGHTRAEADKFLDSFITIVSQGIEKGEEVKLIGFGTFSVSERKARVGRNPQTGEEIQIAARKVPSFRPGKELKTLVNKG